MMAFDHPDQIREHVREIAVEMAERGPGYAQEGVVLREARGRLEPENLKQEQMILESWQQLFARGELAWGYDLDNPSTPFFHLVQHESVAPLAAE
jgi:hypothetical protein